MKIQNQFTNHFINLHVAKYLFSLAALFITVNVAAAPVKKVQASANNTAFRGIAAGTYTISPGPFFPFLAASNDAGTSWNYPRSVLDNLQTSIDPSLVFGLLRGASCSGSGADTVCVALGSFCKNDTCTSQVPLVALSRNELTTWSFPHSVFEDLTTKIDANFARGFFVNGICRNIDGQNFCIAAGLFTNPVQNPLLGMSIDGGTTWTYPKSIFENLQQNIDASYSSGFLESASCNQSFDNNICIASGAFCSGDPCTAQLPLLALTNNKGSSWQYPPVIFKNLKTVIDPDFVSGELFNSACTGSDNQSVCIAVGHFFKSDFNPNPLLALTQTAGNSWTYPPFIYSNLAAHIGHDYTGATFRGASCTGENIRARCVAVGFFNTSKGTALPLVALTKDGGQSWTYPPFFYTKLKTTVDPNVRRASFNSASCIDKNKQSICMIAGNYCTDKSCGHQFPLIAVSIDGGKTWHYPPSVFQNLSTRIDPNLTQAFFSDISCSGSQASSFCVASGQYSTSSATFPLAAYSIDKGATWIYPDYIFKNLTTTVNPDFISGLFNNAGAT